MLIEEYNDLQKKNSAPGVWRGQNFIYGGMRKI
jgi:hypothetical protein